MKALWHSSRGVQWLGIVATVLWLSYVGLETRFDIAHPLFDYIFLVPITGWILLAVRLRTLRKRESRKFTDPSSGAPPPP